MKTERRGNTAVTVCDRRNGHRARDARRTTAARLLATMATMPTFELGSGSDTCSDATRQTDCPSQCCWCVEASVCAPSWQECQIAPLVSGSILPSVILFGVLVAACTYLAYRPSVLGRVAAAAAAGSSSSSHEARAYASYESAEPEDGGENGALPHAPAASGPPTSAPEGQRLLDSDM